MKVELEKVRLAVTAITKEVVVSIPNKAGTMSLHKHEVTSDFLKCIIDFGKNTIFNIDGEENIGTKGYQVACIERGKYKNSLYTRKEVIKLMEQMIKDNVGELINLEQWIEKNMI